MAISLFNLEPMRTSILYRDRVSVTHFHVQCVRALVQHSNQPLPYGYDRLPAMQLLPSAPPPSKGRCKKTSKPLLECASSRDQIGSRHGLPELAFREPLVVALPCHHHPACPALFRPSRWPQRALQRPVMFPFPSRLGPQTRAQASMLRVARRGWGYVQIPYLNSRNRHDMSTNLQFHDCC